MLSSQPSPIWHISLASDQKIWNSLKVLTKKKKIVDFTVLTELDGTGKGAYDYGSQSGDKTETEDFPHDSKALRQTKDLL